MKDIAREAGVSVATVSYVLNNRTEERISEDTRKKVLQIVNLLNYTPNQSAKALATSRSRNIAVYLPSPVSPLKAAGQMYFLNALAMMLRNFDYRLIHLCPQEPKQIDNADAILCYDTPKEEFHHIGDCNFIPLLAVDSRIGDPLFFQISTDFEKLQAKASAFFGGQSFALASLEIQNEAVKSSLEQTFSSVIYIKTLEDFDHLKNRNVLVTEQVLRELLPASCHACYLPSVTEEKLQKVMECVELAINRVQITEHNIMI